ncbi:MAG: DUF6276 family protein [Halodesulfurarchaeum sp.]|nr:DUF6276 family protein [Halodesulfurarchaeum sp.]
MSCPNCGGPTLAFSVPEAVRDHLPAEPEHAELCRDCLTLEPRTKPPAEDPDFTTVLGDFPTGEAGVTAAAFVSLLGSLALHRADIEVLADLAEEQGIDVLLLVDRIAASGRLQPHFDVDRRRPQLEQVLG